MTDSYTSHNQVTSYPLLPLRDVVVFPHMVIPLFVGRPKSIKALEVAMEVGKHILSFKKKDAHMVTSIKPFGCMPSTQSDGVQSKVVSDLKESIFLPIETSGDGEVNVKSRVQMKLYEAKVRAREEVAEALAKHGVTIEDVQQYAREHPDLMRSTQRLPHRYVSVAANFIEKVGPKAARKRK